MNIKPIRSDDDYQAALTEVTSLMDAVPGTEEFDRLEVLMILVEAYEKKHYPIPPPDPISALTYYMESRGLTRRQLEEILNCSSGRVSEILNKKRTLTLGMIRKLHQQFGISAEILINDYAVDDESEVLIATPAC